jgi:hypothetical protein
MNFRLFGCGKFSRLISERDDRRLKPSEERFLERHRYVCVDCRRSERASDCALNMLRAATLEPEVAPTFEDRVLRRLRVQTVRESLNYWSPAFIGAGIACIALFVALHLAASPSQASRTATPAGEAFRDLPSNRPPDLELRTVPLFTR